MPITALPSNIDRRPVQRNAIELSWAHHRHFSRSLGRPARPPSLVSRLARSFSPIKQYLYANHPGLIATALHAWVIRVTITVSRSPIVSFAAVGTYPRFPCATVRGTHRRFIRGTKNPRRRLHRLLQNILIIPSSAFPAPSETRPAGIIIVIMRLQELGMRIVRRATI